MCVKGRKSIIVDSGTISKVVQLYKEFFNINVLLDTKDLTTHDKMILVYHLSDLKNISTKSIADVCGYKHHTSICYHRKKVYDFLRKKTCINSEEFELKFITFNAFFNKNKKQLLQNT